MVFAAMKGRLEEAMVHAWTAYRELDGDPLQEASALTNLGQLLQLSGRQQAALHVYAAALSRKPPKRMLLPSLGGAALAASRLGNERLVRRFVAEIRSNAAGSDFLLDSVQARGEAAFALLPFAPDEAEAMRACAHADAIRAGFHQLAFRFETFPDIDGAQEPDTETSDALAQVLLEANALEVSAEYAGV
jgi:hypothetical protein